MTGDTSDDDIWDFAADLDQSALNEVARLEAQATKNPSLAKAGGSIVSNNSTTARPVASTSKALGVNTGSTGSSRLLQKDLFGNNVHTAGVNSRSHIHYSSQVNAISRKKWDRTTYAKSGALKKGQKAPAKSKGKGKARAFDDDEEEEELDDYDEDFDDPAEAARPPPPMKLQPDREACKTFIYPLNREERDYQFNIVKKAFFTDTLVSLPTGLGKTFLAAVVMLNFYRWFPQGKIIFMAPSRPLVTQQIQACHGIVGIPLKDAVELTGKDPPEKREEEWSKRRVFYCTPQTVANDLHKKRLDPADVICIVIDEAHKAQGDYAYTGVVRYLMRHNPYFRILALTATPGSNADVVQSVIDNLHIGNIEVRTYDSMDITQYIHTKRVDQVVIPVEGEIGSIRDRYAGLMNILLEPLKAKKVYFTNRDDPTTINAYSFQVAMGKLGQSGQKWAYQPLSFLGHMSRAIAKLLEQSVSAFNAALKDLQKQAKGGNLKVINHPDFQGILQATQDIVEGRGFAGHPKMVKLREIVQEHFEACRVAGTYSQTRVMVFCTYREVVEEIVERLNRFSGIKATRLVGQGTDAKGKKGLGQKQQNEVLARFKAGEFNVLVATSIGEEGLDIGELDLIVCYEAPKSSIRTVRGILNIHSIYQADILSQLQRAGRTGRARNGRVVVLMTEGTEQNNWNSAQGSYKDVQNAIVSGKQFELFMDNARLIPDDIKPLPKKEIIHIEPFDADKLTVGHRRTTTTGKRKRDEQDNLDMFDSGFQKASGRKLSSSKSKMAESVIDEAVLVDDGRLNAQEMTKYKRATIKPSVQAAQPAHVRTIPLPTRLPVSPKAGYTTAAQPVKHKSATYSHPQQALFSNPPRTESLAKILRAGHIMSTPGKYKKWEEDTYKRFSISKVKFWPEEKSHTGRSVSFRSVALQEEDRSASLARLCDVSEATGELDHVSSLEEGGPSTSPSCQNLSDNASWEFCKESQSKVLRSPESKGYVISEPQIVNATTAASALPIFFPTGLSPSSEGKAILVSAKPKKSTSVVIPVSIDLDSSDDDIEVLAVLEDRPPPQAKSTALSSVASTQAGRASGSLVEAQEALINLSDERFDDDLEVDELFTAAKRVFPTGILSPSKVDEIIVPPSLGTSPDIFAKPRPPTSTGEDSPVISKAKRPAKRLIVDDDTSSPDKSGAQAKMPPIVRRDVASAPLTQPRTFRKLVRAQNEDRASDFVEIIDNPNRKSKTKRPKKLPGDACPFFDLRAVNSDDPDSETDPEEGGDPETTTDRRFLDSDDIANPGDMSAFYRESLMSQANHRFENELIRPGAFKMRVDATKRYVAPRRSDDDTMEASQWSYDSFVVADDDDIVYDEDEDDGLLDDGEPLTSESK